MKRVFPLIWLLTPAGLLLNAVACSSTVRNKNDGAADATNTGGTGMLSSTHGAAGEGGSAAGSGGSSSTGAGTGGPSGGSGGIGSGGTTGGAGGSGGSGGVGGRGGDSGSGGSSGSGFLPMHCEAGDAQCTCDDSGCFVDPGGACTRDDVCRSANCGVTADSTNICCAGSCESDEVCSSDGSECEPAAACEAGNDRCFQGNYEHCSAGTWSLIEQCGPRGCDRDQGGCLLGVGEPCTSGEQCGEGSCAPTPDGSAVCCTASCGACQVCDTEGTGCTDPDTLPDGCACSESDTSNCTDPLACTNDICNDGVCSNDIMPGFCVIAGQCVSHNAKDPSNPCRYCDAALNPHGWTNASSSTSCDDGLWCNGTDTCDGSGSCKHQYTTNRCTGSGPCDLEACDEERDTCNRPSSHACDTSTETGCSSSGCGGDPRSRTVTTYCSGASSACDGAKVPGTWTVATECSNNSVCNATNQSCELKLGCETSWCDSTGLCWTLQEPSTMFYAEAVEYCEELELAGRSNWRLPTISEWLSLGRGCDGKTGTARDASYISDCYLNRGDFEPSDCMMCPPDEGPGPTGCYWPDGMGACTRFWGGYWSSDMRDAVEVWILIPHQGLISPVNGTALPGLVRCVTRE